MLVPVSVLLNCKFAEANTNLLSTTPSYSFWILFIISIKIFRINSFIFAWQHLFFVYNFSCSFVLISMGWLGYSYNIIIQVFCSFFNFFFFFFFFSFIYTNCKIDEYEFFLFANKVVYYTWCFFSFKDKVWYYHDIPVSRTYHYLGYMHKNFTNGIAQACMLIISITFYMRLFLMMVYANFWCISYFYQKFLLKREENLAHCFLV
jgi:hypothetical protein